MCGCMYVSLWSVVIGSKVSYRVHRVQEIKWYRICAKPHSNELGRRCRKYWHHYCTGFFSFLTRLHLHAHMNTCVHPH